MRFLNWDLFFNTGERPPAVKTFEEAPAVLARAYTFVPESIECREKKICDVGCGMGYGAYHLAQQGAAYVLGIDYSRHAIQQARKNFSHPKLEFSKDSLETLPDHRFDLVTSFQTIEHIADYRFFLFQICRILKPGGYVVISTPNKML